jgi:integrase
MAGFSPVISLHRGFLKSPLTEQIPTRSGSKRRLKLKKFSDAERINASHRYQRQRLRHYVLWIVYTGMRPGEVHKLRYRHIVVRHTPDSGAKTLRIKVPHGTKTGARLVIALPAAVGVYQSLQQQTQHSGKQDDLRYAQSSARSGAKSPSQPVCQRPVSRC